MNTLIQLVKDGQQALNAKNIDKAFELLHRAYTLQPNNADILFLYGVTLEKQGKLNDSIVILQKSKRLKPSNYMVLNSLANTYKKAGKLEDAINEYKAAIALKPDYIDPMINLAKIFADTGNDYELNALRVHLNKLHIHAPLIELQYARDLKNKGDLKAAKQMLAPLIEQGHPSILHEYALTLRMNDESALAINYYKYLETLGLNDASFYHNFGNALSDVGELQTAMHYYQKALTVNPFLLDTHENLIDVMWELGLTETALHKIVITTEASDCPNDIKLLFVKKLIRISKFDEANRFVRQWSSTISPQSIDAIYLDLSSILLLPHASHTSNEIALQHQYENILTSELISLDDKVLVLEAMILMGNFSLTLTATQKLLKASPDNQHLLAILHTCYLFGEALEHPVTGIHQYTFEYHIKKPDHYDNLQDYLGDLINYVESLHNSELAPLEQTLIGGTQTRANLFSIDHPLINHIKDEYRNAVIEYVNASKQLPALYRSYWPSTEFNKSNIDFSGSWSVLLRKEGFHSNHIHPQGWLSSVLYLDLPDISDNKEGWLKLGQPPYKIDDAYIEPKSYVQPSIGKLVLFPSCLWHGTVPFHSGDKRLTIACDIVKKS